MTRKARQRRAEILVAARWAAARGDHMVARLLFASVDISYVPKMEVQS